MLAGEVEDAVADGSRQPTGALLLRGLQARQPVRLEAGEVAL